MTSLDAVARNIVNQVLDESLAPVEVRQDINDRCDQFVLVLLKQVQADGERRVVEAVREFSELLVEQGDEHVPGCMGQADCAACVKTDLDTLLTRFDGGALHDLAEVSEES